MAVLGSIGSAVYRHGIPSTAPAEAHETLGGAPAAARGHADLLGTARAASTHGMNAAVPAGGVLLLVAAGLAVPALRRSRS
ncbi:hypothetical protein GCM10018793_35770 [Streptomyces sulfonofaciens]|uniref:Uncharacterized protein n=1 Tax=Streptomyces sulfonofaciens TaxID=68272 RepID=A0A919L2L0_9ACTN|nr:hypothetical protein GCM10018793_35770 [Streptomyces sulfonofaciens]